MINGVEFSSNVIPRTFTVFPQDVRNCTRCHDGTAGSPIYTPQGDNWKIQPSMQACGACHDNVYFGTRSPIRPNRTRP